MPDLVVIAGCNGAGKSTFASSLLPDNLASFDYDLRYSIHYKGLPDSQLRDHFAKENTTREFEDALRFAIEHDLSFCYETNFDVHPIHWAAHFRKQGYRLNLVFFCIDSIELAKLRIQMRTEFYGHFVNDETIEWKWQKGYENVDDNFSYFDNLLFIDNSMQNKIYTNLVQLEGDKVTWFVDELPGYFRERLPKVYNHITHLSA